MEVKIMSCVVNPFRWFTYCQFERYKSRVAGAKCLRIQKVPMYLRVHFEYGPILYSLAFRIDRKLCINQRWAEDLEKLNADIELAEKHEKNQVANELTEIYNMYNAEFCQKAEGKGEGIEEGTHKKRLHQGP